VQQITEAILADSLTDIGALPVPESYRAVVVREEDQEMFAGMPAREKDPRTSLHVQDVPTPELGPGEALVAVMASAVNYNTVWTSIFEPVSTFGFLKRYGKLSSLTKRHDLPYHVVGSDLAGVVVRVGIGVNNWKPGDEVVAHCLSVELEDPAGHDDTMLDRNSESGGSRPTSAGSPTWPWSSPTS
jgi:crotonyl-CoA reductase